MDTTGEVRHAEFGRADNDGVPGEQRPKQTRERSTIAFPYDDLEAAEEIVQAVHARYGGKATREQIAAELRASATSGTFRMKLSTARLYGFVEADRHHITMTELGMRLMDEATAPRARVDGFLSVPLYSALFERYRQGTLPGSKGLEEAIRELGVASKQVPVARQAFYRSASRAGFFHQGENRLVLPPIGTVGNGRPDEVKGNDEPPEDEPGMQADPLLASLFKRLPPADERYGRQERENFVTALEAIFTIVYGPAEEEGRDERRAGAGGGRQARQDSVGPSQGAQGHAGSRSEA